MTQGAAGASAALPGPVVLAGAGPHGRPQPVPKAGPSFVVHGRRSQLHRVDTLQRAQRPAHLGGQLVQAGVVGDGQGQLEAHVAAADLHRAHQAELGQAQAQARVLDRARGLPHIGFGDGHGTGSLLRGGRDFPYRHR